MDHSKHRNDGALGRDTRRNTEERTRQDTAVAFLPFSRSQTGVHRDSEKKRHCMTRVLQGLSPENLMKLYAPRCLEKRMENDGKVDEG